MSDYYEAPDYCLEGEISAATVFLAGGITGVERWHDRAAHTLLGAGVTVFNPNRANFPIDDPAAGWEQVSWEQHHLHLADVTLFWFPASDRAVTTQPIAMFELGQALGENRRIVVGASSGYPREADVRMLCRIARPGMTVHSTLDSTISATITELVENQA